MTFVAWYAVLSDMEDNNNGYVVKPVDKTGCQMSYSQCEEIAQSLCTLLLVVCDRRDGDNDLAATQHGHARSHVE